MFVATKVTRYSAFYSNAGDSQSPDIVFTHYRSDRHQNHRVISDLTWNTFRNHLILEAFYVRKLQLEIGSNGPRGRRV